MRGFPGVLCFCAPGFPLAERVWCAAVCNGGLRFSRWRRKSEVHVGQPNFWMREGLERAILLEGSQDQYVKRSWGPSPMISASGFLGRIHEWRWMKKTHGVENLLTHLCLSKRHPLSQGALHRTFQGFIVFLTWILKDLSLLFLQI